MGGEWWLLKTWGDPVRNNTPWVYQFGYVGVMEDQSVSLDITIGQDSGSASGKLWFGVGWCYINWSRKHSGMEGWEKA